MSQLTDAPDAILIASPEPSMAPPADALETSGVDSVPGNVTSTVTLAIGGADSGYVNTPGDYDWYRVELTAGQSYVFAADGAGAAPLEDTYLKLFNSAGSLIAIDDDGGPGRNSVLRFTASVSGTYFLGVGAWEPESGPYLTGSYNVSAALGPPQNPLDAIDLGFVLPSSTVSVYFAAGGQTFNGDTAVRSWNTTEISAAFAAFHAFEVVANLHFVQTFDSNAATFVLSLVNLNDNVLGQFSTINGKGYGEFAPSGYGWTSAGLQPGGQGFVTLLHEIGHGLGLAHPHDNGGTSEIMQGVLSEFNSYGTYLLNQEVFTIMSYNSGWQAPSGHPYSATSGNQATPAALDIALLQEKYGVNTTTNADDTSYQFTSLTSGGSAYSTVWDAGGTDTIVYSGTGQAVIDLRAATLQGARDGGGRVSYLLGGVGGFTIAAGVVIENAQGGSNNDIITGNDADNTLWGNAGNDTLLGGGGQDHLLGGDGADTLDGGPGADIMDGGDGIDTYWVDDPNDVVIELLNGGGVDKVVSTTYAYTLSDNLEYLELADGASSGTGNALCNHLYGNQGNNFLYGMGGSDVLLGDAGDDWLDGGADGDAMIGGPGNDTYVVDNIDDNPSEQPGQGVDLILSSISWLILNPEIENITLTGLAAIDANGNALANVLVGNNAANSLDGRAGADTLIGGLGDDIYYVDNVGDVVTEGVDEGVDTIKAFIAIAALAANIENLELIGAGLTGVGNSLDNRITGNADANILDGLTGADTLIGSGGDDVYYVDNLGDMVVEQENDGLDAVYASVSFVMPAYVEMLSLFGSALNGIGNESDNTIIGNAQNNVLDGRGGADVLAGDMGDDTYVVDNAGDVVTESPAAGVDCVSSLVDLPMLFDNVENLMLVGLAVSGAGNDLANDLSGNNQANVLSGGAGADVLDGRFGADTLIGGAGNDVYYIDAGDVIVEQRGEGDDLVYASASVPALADNVERVTLLGLSDLDVTGNGLANRINGNGGANVLDGAGGADVIVGLGGDDTLIGGSGADTLTGGAGADSFVYLLPSDSSPAAGDLITDFTPGLDKIDLHWIDANANLSGDQAFDFIGGAAFTFGLAGQMRYEWIDAPGAGDDLTVLGLEVNGDGVADAQITLKGLVTLDAGDFWL